MTHPALTSEPLPGGQCRVCGAQMPQGSLHCSHCGATYGESNRCPHCRAVTEVEPSGALRFRCRVCGGPRVPVDDPDVVRSGREIQLLSSAQQARRRSAAWRVGAGLVAGFAALSFAVSLVVWLIASPGVLGSLGLLVMLAVPIVLALLARRRARTEALAQEHALDQAWALVAADVLASRGGELNSAELARIMRIDEARAELLLGQLNVNDFVHARVTEDGDVVYSSRAPERLRVPGAIEVAELEPTAAEALEDSATSGEPPSARRGQ